VTGGKFKHVRLLGFFGIGAGGGNPIGGASTTGEPRAPVSLRLVVHLFYDGSLTWCWGAGAGAGACC